ncbi:MAG: ABC transporter permease [Rhodocyclales bacterium GT-UBC]|nr:MAG: ABC transporter permease [Rhodocyclales bacterium GT-UBC]
MPETLALETREVSVTPVPHTHDEPARSAVSSRLLPVLEASLIWIFLLGGWFVAAEYLPLGDNPLVPSPLITARALWDSLPELWLGTISSFGILVPGFLLASLAGIGLGLSIGTSPRLQRAFFPFARVAAPVPPTVYIPYAIAILPTFKLSAIFVVFIGAFWPIFQNAAAGAHALEERYRDNARILGLSGFEYHRRVVFPAALPHIFSGMAVGLGFSFILLTVAELFGANAGLGRFVQYYADFADYPKMVAGILYTGLVTFLAMTGLEKLKRRALFWQR